MNQPESVSARRAFRSGSECANCRSNNYVSPSERSNPSEKKSEETESDKKWDRAERNFLMTTTLHGISHLPTSTPWQKRLWITAVFICSVVLIIHTSFLLYNVSTRPPFFTTLTYEYRKVGLDSTDDTAPAFPTVTVCSLSPLKAINYESNEMTLAQYASLSLGFPYTAISMEDRMLLRNVIMEENDSLTAAFQAQMDTLEEEYKEMNKSNNLKNYIISNSHSCSDVFASCVHGLSRLNCCELSETILTNLGLCQSLHLQRAPMSEVTSTIPIVIELHDVNSQAEEYENGYYLVTHDYRISPRFLLISDGTLIPPGAVINMKISATLIDYSVQYSDWLGLSYNCPQAKYVDSNYSLMECALWTASEAIKRICNCTWIIVPEKDQDGMKICGPQEMTKCFMANSDEIFRETTECRLPCLDYVYNPSVSHGQLAQIRKKKHSRISISYDRHSFYHNIYHRHYLSSVFSDIGGATGLLLGASAITGVEILTILGQWIYYKVLCRR